MGDVPHIRARGHMPIKDMIDLMHRIGNDIIPTQPKPMQDPLALLDTRRPLKIIPAHDGTVAINDALGTVAPRVRRHSAELIVNSVNEYLDLVAQIGAMEDFLREMSLALRQVHPRTRAIEDILKRIDALIFPGMPADAD